MTPSTEQKKIASLTNSIQQITSDYLQLIIASNDLRVELSLVQEQLKQSEAKVSDLAAKDASPDETK